MTQAVPDFVLPPLPEVTRIHPVDIGKAPEIKPAQWNILTADEFFKPPPEQKFAIPYLGIGPGPVFGIVGQWYTGKTLATLSMGLAYVFGKLLWGQFPVPQGTWDHLDHEQGALATKERVRRLARGMGITDAGLRDAIESGRMRLSIYPEVNLTTEAALTHYRKFMEGRDLVTADSLRPMIGNVDENSSQVRSLINVLSRASDAEACASVLLHHAGKTPLEGKKSRKEIPRGSSGIIDEFQGYIVMTKNKEDALAKVSHEKDRALGMTVQDFGLRIEDVCEPHDENDVDAPSANPKWGLKVTHVSEEDMKSDTSGITENAQRIRLYLASNPVFEGSQEALRDTLEMGTVPFRVAFAHLRTHHEVEMTGGRGMGRTIRYVPPEPVPEV